MAAPKGQAPNRLVVVCLKCNRPLTARPEWAGREVECPHCASALRVPTIPSDGLPVRGEAPVLAAKFRFNFGCPRCDTLLETHTGASGQPGCCPTCAARLVVPALDVRTGKPRPAALLDTDAQDPTPLHAYAASGEQAPQIQRLGDGTLVIECPRCGAQCDVDADSCRSCGSPFTIDAAPTTTSHTTESWAMTSLVLGAFSLPLFIVLLPAALAVVFGVLTLHAGQGRRFSPAGLIGLILGLISLAGGAAWWLFR